jgi:hypothetical protein
MQGEDRQAIASSQRRRVMLQDRRSSWPPTPAATIDGELSGRPVRWMRPGQARLGSLTLAVTLAACAPGSPTAESLLVVPGYYDTLDCRELTEDVHKSSIRVQELSKLRERSATGAGGTMINVLAYDTEYAKARATLRNATDSATRKGCDLTEKPPTPAPTAKDGRRAEPPKGAGLKQ